MMKKWYFSKQGNVTGPLGLEEATTFANNNPEIYGWNPSYTQWRPVTMLKELGNIVSNEEPKENALTELTQKFEIKKQRLDKKFKVIEERIETNENLLSTLHEEITLYKKLTANLNDGVKAAINKTEQHYLSLQEKQMRLHEAASIATMEIETLVNQFNERMSGISKPPQASNKQNAKSKQTEEQVAEEYLIDDIDEALLREVVEEKPEKQRKVKLVDVNANQKNANQKDVAENRKPASQTKHVIKKDVLIENTPDVQNDIDDEDKKGFGVKNLFKSVFKADDENSEASGDSLSKMLAMEEEAEHKRAVNESPIVDSTLEEDDDKKARRRTRRRR